MSDFENQFIRFPVDKWKYLGPDMNRVKNNARLERISDKHQNFGFANIIDVYSPLAEFFYVCYRDANLIKQSRSHFLEMAEPQTPFIIGVAGSVSSGKSSLSLLLKSMFESFNDELQVDVVSTDSFLMTNAQLREREMNHRKGFPDSYHRSKMLRFVQAVSSGEERLQCPVYDHGLGDIIAGHWQTIDRPDVFILEGLNILQNYQTSPTSEAQYISDYFDVSVFLDAETEDLERWYVERFQELVVAAKTDRAARHHKYLELSYDERMHTARRIWRDINQKNLIDNILPTRARAEIILHKQADHAVDHVLISKHWI